MKRSRSAILVGILGFAALQLGLSRSIESDALPVRDPIYTEKLALLRKHPEFWRETSERPRILALGSSRTQLLIDAKRLEPDARAFNFGCSSCGPIAQLLYLRRLIGAGVRADVLLIEVHPALLAELPEPFEWRWLHPHRLRPGEGDVLRDLHCRAEPSATAGCHWLHASSHYRFALLNEYAPGLLPGSQAIRRSRASDDFGYVTSIDAAPALRAELTANAEAEYRSAFADYRPGGPAVLALRRMVELGRAHSMRPMLFVGPESSEFRNWYGAAGNARIAEFLDRFALDLAVPLHASRDWLRDDDFVDGHHATPRGARIFTDRIAGELGR